VSRLLEKTFNFLLGSIIFSKNKNFFLLVQLRFSVKDVNNFLENILYTYNFILLVKPSVLCINNAFHYYIIEAYCAKELVISLKTLKILNRAQTFKKIKIQVCVCALVSFSDRRYCVASFFYSFLFVKLLDMLIIYT